MKKKKGKLTDRDVDILNFINQFGFCEMPHIQARFNLKRARSYQLLDKLREMGLVMHELVFSKKHGIFRLTAEGARCTPLPRLKAIPMDSYRHQVGVIEVFLKLRKLYPEAAWISERQLKKEKFAKGFKKRGHLADGLLIMGPNEQIAIEVELKLKDKERRDEILKGYAKTDFTHVWYFCAPDIFSAMKTAAARYTYIKIYNIREFLNDCASAST